MKHLLKTTIERIMARAVESETVRGALFGRLPMQRPDALSTLSNRDGPIIEREGNNGTRFRDDIVFVTSRFRSGSTALWNAFRQLEDMTAYYEPFNERRFFDAGRRGSGVDPTHVGVKDYAREYDATRGLDTLYSEDWTRRALYMDEHTWNPDMLRFIEILVESATGRPVMQFNRVDFRLPWLRHNFPNASIVHLWRNPREQWCSVLGDLDRYPSDKPPSAIPDRFYQCSWINDLRQVMPFLSDGEAMHPYRRFYLLWKTSWLFGQRYATTSFSYESLTGAPDKTLGDLAATLNLGSRAATRMRMALVDPRPERWPEYASSSWFEEHERACEVLLDRFFGRNERSPSIGDSISR